MKRIGVQILMFLLSISAHSQFLTKEPVKTRNVIINEGDTIIRISVLTGAYEIRCESDKMYYWYDNEHVQCNEGGYSGKLLHGDYTVFAEGVLIEKGTFDEGLKVGLWKNWFRSGHLAKTQNYKNGLLQGLVSRYEDYGALFESTYYKNGIKNGPYQLHLQDTIITEKYKNGVMINPKK